MIYLDHNSTTYIASEVKLLVSKLVNEPLNASSIHSKGRFSKNLIEEARNQIASALCFDINSNNYVQVIFTSSGTEANNLIIRNFLESEVFISATEHDSILEQQFYTPNIKLISVDNNGLINLEELESALAKSTSSRKLISVMLANNESGVIQPIKKIVAIAKKFGAYTHSDCVQGVGKIPVNISELGIDFATISGHKFGGLIGAAALIINTKFILRPIIRGGGQERGARAGTENVLAIAGLGLAIEMASRNLLERYENMSNLQKKIEEGVKSVIPNIKIIGKDVERLPNTSLIVIPGFDAEIQLIALDLRGIQISSGAACSNNNNKRSRVLTAMRLEDSDIKSAIRISCSHKQKEQDINIFLETFAEVYKTK